MLTTAKGLGGIRRVVEPQSGLAAWLLVWFQTPLRERFARISKARAERRMELVEVLALGGKRQMMLVLCDGQRFLVGVGGDSVHSVTALSPVAGASAGTGLAGGGVTNNAGLKIAEVSGKKRKCGR